MRTLGGTGVVGGLPEVGKPDVANKIMRMARVVLIQAKYFDVLHYLMHKSTLGASDMVDKVFI